MVAGDLIWGEIGLVRNLPGSTISTLALVLDGTRLNKLYRQKMTTNDEIVSELKPVLEDLQRTEMRARLSVTFALAGATSGKPVRGPIFTTKAFSDRSYGLGTWLVLKARRYSNPWPEDTRKPGANISTLDEDEALDFIDSLQADPFVLLLDQCKDPRNLGACLRSADGAGVDLVVMPTDRSAGPDREWRPSRGGGCSRIARFGPCPQSHPGSWEN